MKIHSICMVKDEADIIEQTLKSAEQWSDFIYVFDNGSTDGTWERVLELAKRSKVIIPYKQEACWFHDGLRSEVFHYYRSSCSEGDWWCRLDADEIYIDNPRTFLSNIPAHCQWVWGTSFQYYFTDRDLERYEQNPSLYADEIPIEERLRYYQNDWSEARFFRYDRHLVWDNFHPWPYLGATYPKRIRLKHFQYRSPQQIQKRLSIRLKIANAGGVFRHESRWLNSVGQTDPKLNFNTALEENQELWHARIHPASKLLYDYHDGHYLIREDAMPPLTSSFPHVRNHTRGLKMMAIRLKRLSQKSRS